MPPGSHPVVESIEAAEAGAPSRAPVRAGDIEIVVFVLMDGVRADVTRALSESGDLPNITRHLTEAGSNLDAASVLPSVTDVAYLPMLTGQYPGTANMPGVRWVDKSRFTSGKLFVKGHRSYVGASHLRFDDDLGDGLETLFELSPGSLAVRSDIHRGLSPGFNRVHGILGPLMFLAHSFQRAALIDRIVLGSFSRALRRMEDHLPRFVFLPLIDVDYASHGHGPHHPKTISAYRRVDAAVGAIVDRLKRMGLWHRTHLLLSSDHGHTKTAVHLDLNRLLSELGYSVFEHPNIFRRKVDAAIMISGNSFANVYVSSESRWEKPLTGDELEGEHKHLLAALRGRDEIEWIAYRDYNGGIKVVSSSGMALLDKKGESYIYSHDGSDPLELHLSSSTIHESDALQLTMPTRFPDALEQIWHLFSSRRTGDIVVTSRPGYDLRGWREWPEHRSSHGALCREHMIVPIISSHPLSAEGPVRTVDVFSTVVESLGLSPMKPHFGRSLW